MPAVQILRIDYCVNGTSTRTLSLSKKTGTGLLSVNRTSTVRCPCQSNRNRVVHREAMQLSPKIYLYQAKQKVFQLVKSCFMYYRRSESTMTYYNERGMNC
ncbi:hypothetical protein DAI22_02g037300 [Oryza sativa Japonica Group]|nr:hypothetical protein DAI22_02g037300 [Oryza sativa Japonica Group]